MVPKHKEEEIKEDAIPNRTLLADIPIIDIFKDL